MRYIGEHLLPHLLAHFNFTMRSEEDFIRDMIPIMNDFSYADDVAYMQAMEKRHFQTFSKYRDSPYPSGGMHYRVLLMLIEKIPSLGQNNRFCKMCSFACKVVVQMCYMLYPDILERNYIHVPPPNPSEESQSTEAVRDAIVLVTMDEVASSEVSQGEEDTAGAQEKESIFVFRASASDM